jgi:hypothetical protein
LYHIYFLFWGVPAIGFPLFIDIFVAVGLSVAIFLRLRCTAPLKRISTAIPHADPVPFKIFPLAA